LAEEIRKLKEENHNLKIKGRQEERNLAN